MKYSQRVVATAGTLEHEEPMHHKLSRGPTAPEAGGGSSGVVCNGLATPVPSQSEPTNAGCGVTHRLHAASAPHLPQAVGTPTCPAVASGGTPQPPRAASCSTRGNACQTCKLLFRPHVKYLKALTFILSLSAFLKSKSLSINKTRSEFPWEPVSGLGTHSCVKQTLFSVTT